MRAGMTSETFASIRLGVLALTALSCLAYAGDVLLIRSGTIPPWLPGVFGAISALLIWLTGRVAGRAAHRASDEGFYADWGRAQRHAYWIAVALYPAFALLMAAGTVDFDRAFPAMAVLTGGAVLVLFTLYDLRGRG